MSPPEGARVWGCCVNLEGERCVEQTAWARGAPRQRRGVNALPSFLPSLPHPARPLHWSSPDWSHRAQECVYRGKNQPHKEKHEKWVWTVNRRCLVTDTKKEKILPVKLWDTAYSVKLQRYLEVLFHLYSKSSVWHHVEKGIYFYHGVLFWI